MSKQITTQTYGTHQTVRIGYASCIFNLMSNIGCSSGIFVAQILLTRRADARQNEILKDVPKSGYFFQRRPARITGYLERTDPSNWTVAAPGQIYPKINSLALLWALVDVFRWTRQLCFSAVFLVLPLR